MFLSTLSATDSAPSSSKMVSKSSVVSTLTSGFACVPALPDAIVIDAEFIVSNPRGEVKAPLSNSSSLVKVLTVSPSSCISTEASVLFLPLLYFFEYEVSS